MASTPARNATSPTAGSVVISAEAHARLVARVGRSAATTFVAVALIAAPDDRGALVARTSARVLARRLDIAKDTAAGDLAWLVKRGYLRRLAQPRSGGQFAAAVYVVRPPAGFDVVASGDASRPCPASPDTGPAPRRRPTPTSEPNPIRRARTSGRHDQLGLFGAASSITETRSPR